MPLIDVGGSIKLIIIPYHICTNNSCVITTRMVWRLSQQHGIYCALLLAVITWTLPVQGRSENGKLNLTTLEHDKIVGHFSGAKNRGIQFLSEIKDGYHVLQITTLQGKLLYRTEGHASSHVLASILGQELLIANITGTPSQKSHSSSYHVPSNWSQLTKNVVRQKISLHTVLPYLDQEKANSTLRTAISALLPRLETRYVVMAARALGKDIRILGKEYPAAMNLYVLAMRLSKSPNRVNAEALAQSSNYYDGSNACAYSYCTQNGACCTMCPVGGDCEGMCGGGCSCWSWVCGDCCYHQGCYDHDRCCTDFYTAHCLIPWGFSCDSYACY